MMRLLTRFFLWLGDRAFRKIQFPREHPPTPDWPGAIALEVRSKDGTTIRGWWQREARTAGTVIFVHGVTVDSFRHVEAARYLANETGLSMAALDLRSHGLSDDAPLSFGAAESWDVLAFLDGLENAGAARPFIVIGDSLGGLAVQRAVVEDSRIDGAVLMQTPGWAWNAIQQTGKRLAPLGRFLNSHFGYNILSDGDPRTFVTATPHRPPLLYIVGDRDLYDWTATRLIYDWWATPNAGELNETPLTFPDRSRWFILVEDAVHDTGRPDCYNVWRWPQTWPNIVRFVEIVRQRHTGS